MDTEIKNVREKVSEIPLSEREREREREKLRERERERMRQGIDLTSLLFAAAI